MNEEEQMEFQDIKEMFNPFDMHTQQQPGQQIMAWMYFDKGMREEYMAANPDHPIDWGCGVCGTQYYSSLVMMSAMLFLCDGCYEVIVKFFPHPVATEETKKWIVEN